MDKLIHRILLNKRMPNKKIMKTKESQDLWYKPLLDQTLWLPRKNPMKD